MEDVQDSTDEPNVFETSASEKRISNKFSTPLTSVDPLTDVGSIPEMKHHGASRVQASLGSGSDGQRLESEEFENISVNLVDDLTVKSCDKQTFNNNSMQVKENDGLNKSDLSKMKIKEANLDDMGSRLNKKGLCHENGEQSVLKDLKTDTNNVELETDQSVDQSLGERSQSSLETADEGEVCIFLQLLRTITYATVDCLSLYCPGNVRASFSVDILSSLRFS